jgi:hypothetical protein
MAVIGMMMIGALGVSLVVWVMHRLPQRAQFLVLCILGLSIGFLFLTLVELPTFSVPLAVVLLTVVVCASVFAVPIFLRSLDEEKKDGG